MCDGKSDRCCCGHTHQEHSHPAECTPEQIKECKEDAKCENTCDSDKQEEDKKA